MTHDYPPLTGGGLALSVRDLAQLAQDHADVVVMSSRLADHFTDDRAVMGRGEDGAVRLLHVRPGAGLVRAIRGTDLLVAHWTFSFRPLATLSVLLGPTLGVRTVCVIHTSPEHARYNRLRRLPDGLRRALSAGFARALRRCAAVVALSDAHAASLGTAGFPVTHVLPLMVGDRAGGEARPATGPRATSRRPVVGVVGELSALKGADRIPWLATALGPDFDVRVAGSGPLQQPLLKAVAALPAGGRSGVCFVGRLAPASMPRYYAEIDVLAVLSRTEAQCRVVLEAMLAGVLVAASSDCGVEDLVRHPRTGLLLDPEDPRAWRAHLTQMVRDPIVSRSMRRAALDFAVDRHRSSRVEWSHFLEEHLGAPDATSPRSQRARPGARRFGQQPWGYQ